MTELRWILLGAGLAMLAGLYLWGVRQRHRSGLPDVERPARPEPPPVPPLAPAAEHPRVEPQVRLDEEPTAAPVRASPRREPTIAPDVPAGTPPAGEPTVEAATPPKSQKIIAVLVTARPPEKFGGAELHEALRSEGLEFGRYDIFHRLDPAGRPVFSTASLVEPGTFDPRTMAECAYPGIALFAVLPGPVSAQQAFEALLTTAHSLAGRLGGGLQDDRGAPLSMQRLTAMREEVLEFDRAGHAPPGP